MTASREMPKFQCHKEVWALKIKAITEGTSNSEFAILQFEEADYASLPVSADWHFKHKPEPGGYYVVYQDGYKSYSPAAAFESGYTPKMAVPIQHATAMNFGQAIDVASDPQAILCVKPGEPLKAAPITLSVIDAGPDALDREIQAKASSGPRVTPADIEAEIVSEHYFTAEDGFIGAAAVKHRKVNVVMSMVSYDADKVQSLNLLTFCVLALRNGTQVVGVNYGAIDPAQHSIEEGRKSARAEAVEQCRPLLGFRLRDELARPVLTEADALADLAGTPRPNAPSA